MNSSGKPSSQPNPDISEIYRIAPQISDAMYRPQGVGGLSGILPGKILCFSRLTACELLGILKLQQSPGSSVRADHHHRCVLLVAVRGGGQLCLDGDVFDIQEGQAQFICPFQFHSYSGIKERICWIFITFEILSPPEIEPLRSSPSLPIGPTEWVLLRELLDCWLCKDRHSLLSHHLGLLLRRFCASATQVPGVVRPNAAADILARINRYVQPRLDQPLSLPQVAEALGISESHLRAQFRTLTGSSLGHHLRELRIMKACSLLHGTALTITQIAEQCGFESVYSFSRTFKTSRGLSPRSYRNAPYGKVAAR
jgi:AraC-like DNA-binding protein